MYIFKRDNLKILRAWKQNKHLHLLLLLKNQ